MPSQGGGVQISELNARGVDDVYIEYYNTGKHELAQVYLKAEADAVIAELEEKLKVQTSIAEEGWKESADVLF